MGAVAGISSGATRECMHAVTRRRRPLPPRMAREGGGGVCEGRGFEEDLEGDASIPGENAVFRSRLCCQSLTRRSFPPQLFRLMELLSTCGYSVFSPLGGALWIGHRVRPGPPEIFAVGPMRRISLRAPAAMGTRSPRRVVTSAAAAPKPFQQILTVWVEEDGDRVE